MEFIPRYEHVCHAKKNIYFAVFVWYLIKMGFDINKQFFGENSLKYKFKGTLGYASNKENDWKI